MSDPREPALEEGVARLWVRFRPVLLARVEAMERAADALARGALDAELRREAAWEAHKLAGAAGSFGLREVSELARGVEDLLGGDAPLSPQEAARVAARVAECRARMDAAPLAG